MAPAPERWSVARWQLFFVDRPAEALRWIGILVLVACSGLALLEIRTDGAAVYPQGDEAVERSAADRAVFDDPEQALLLLTAAPGAPPIASAAGVQRLRALHESLEAVEQVDATRVRSVASLVDSISDMKVIDLERPFEEPPADANAFAGWLEHLREFPLLDGLFLSRDGRAAVLYAPLLAGGDRDDFVSALDGWVNQSTDAATELRLTGPVAAEVMLGRTVLRDLAWLVPIMVAVMALLLFLSLRTWAGVLIPLAEVLLVLLVTLGSMGLLGVPITLVTTLLPVVLMTVAVTDEIHLLERFQTHLNDAASRDSPEREIARRRQAMLAAIDDVRRPIVLTSLTTSVGFLSFLTASMAPIQHFGVFAAVGILVAMLASFSFVPALAMVLPAAFFVPRLGQADGVGPRLAWPERWVIAHSRWAVALALLAVAAAAPGLARLEVQDSWIGNFDADSQLVSAERDFNDRFWGTYRLDIVMSSSEPYYFQSREGLQLMERVRKVALAGHHVGGFASHLVPFGVLARAIGEDQAVSSLPKATLLRVSALAWLGSDTTDLPQYLARGGASARARVFVNSADYARAVALRDYLAATLPPVLAPAGVEFHLSGDLAVATAVVDSIVTNQLRSIAWTVCGVAVLLLVAYRSALLAALVMAPLAAALPLVLGGMGEAGMPLGIATSMFAALAIGLGVDFGLHVVHGYRRARARGGGHGPSLVATLESSGRAIRWNAAVLTFGFLVLTLSALKPNRSLGMLLCAAVIACYAMTLLLMPYLLELLHRDGREPIGGAG